MVRLKELHKDDKAKLQQEMMALYKREKVNPISGCLPVIIQIPFFFAIYKMLYVTLEMRHQPFFGQNFIILLSKFSVVGMNHLDCFYFCSSYNYPLLCKS